MKSETFIRDGGQLRPAHRKHILKEVFNVNNYTSLQPDADWSEKFTRILKMYGWILLCMLLSTLITTLANFFVVHVLNHKSPIAIEKRTIQQVFKVLGTPVAFLFVCLIGPLFEELIFRLPLAFKKRQVMVSLLVGIFYMSAIFFRGKGEYIQTILQLEIIAMIIIAILCQLFIHTTNIDISHHGKKTFIILSILLFGLLHISNFRPLDTGILWLYPVFVLPQLLMGWAITCIRFKNGFWWGLSLHCLINTVSTLLTFGFKH